MRGVPRLVVAVVDHSLNFVVGWIVAFLKRRPGVYTNALLHDQPSASIMASSPSGLPASAYWIAACPALRQGSGPHSSATALKTIFIAFRASAAVRAVHSLFEVLHPHCFRLSIASTRLRAVILMFSDVAQRLVYKGTLCRIRSSPSHRVHFHSSTVTHKMRSFTTLAVLAAVASAPLLVW